MEPRPTSPAGCAEQEGGESGFTLLEVVCVVAIIAILAAIALPALPFGTSRARLESYAVDAAAMLQADRYAAIRRRREVVADVNVQARSLRSGATGRVLRVPNDVVFRAVLPARCNQRPAGSTIRFFASGMSCGGAIALSRPGAGYEVRVNWLTGGVEIVSLSAL